ncbi:uncharacterized protein RVIR1_13250 [Candidatus Rickettsiella viridis]|uniref:Ankyrin repeat protein n=1 Tax=Candidatus Rickettsiella viridis TaxID=676208 RepID=A0A2Z5V5T2_9COXI|nr:hypothetical protein [Candidatus Rickettsiella viridis]BBB15772.1 uncharacterized protein RVIR1_13250 [Candidatus Rickettsiella viridis]
MQDYDLREEFIFKNIANMEGRWGYFVEGLLSSGHEQQQPYRKQNSRAGYTVRLRDSNHEVVPTDKAHRVPALSPEEKALFTKPTATTYANPKRFYRPGSVFGRGEVGIRVSVNNVKPQRIYTRDQSTFERPYDFDSEKAAQMSIDRTNISNNVICTSFSSLIREAVGGEHNEAIVRLERDFCHPSKQIVIFDESIESKLIAQARKRDLERALKGKYPNKYIQIPISFYQNEKYTIKLAKKTDRTFYHRTIYLYLKDKDVLEYAIKSPPVYHINRIAIDSDELNGYFNSIKTKLEDASQTNDIQLSVEEEKAIYSATSKQGIFPALSYYTEKAQKEDAAIVDIDSEKNPYKIFLVHEKEDFKNLTIDTWKKILPIISELSDVTKLAAYNAIQENLENTALSFLIINNKNSILRFINAIPTKKLATWLNSEEKISAIIQDKDILGAILKRLPLDNFQDKIFYTHLTKVLPKIIKPKVNDVCVLANQLTADRRDKLILLLIESGITENLIREKNGFYTLLSYCVSEDIKDKIYIAYEDKLAAIIQENNHSNLIRVLPKNCLGDFYRNFRPQRREILQREDPHTTEILELLSNDLLVEVSNASLDCLFIQLKVIKKKADELEKRGYHQAAVCAETLYTKIKNSAEDFDKKKISTQTFREQCFQAIQTAKPELEKHRGWKQVLGNLALAILGLGIFYVAAGLIHKGISGKFLFFNNTNSAKKLATLDKTIQTAIENSNNSESAYLAT